MTKRFVQARGAWTAKDNELNQRLAVGHDRYLSFDNEGRLIYEEFVDMGHRNSLNWLNHTLLDDFIFIRPSTNRGMHDFEKGVWGHRYPIIGYQLQKEADFCKIRLVLGNKEECRND